MREQIEQAILRKAKAVLRKQRVEVARELKFASRYARRTGNTAGVPSTSDPAWWEFHPHFNPRYCISHADYLSKVIWKKLQEGSYRPTPCA